MMHALYMIILLASAALASWGGGRILARLGNALGLGATLPQLAISLSIIAFLLVVSMPAGILIGMLVLLATPLLPQQYFSFLLSAGGLLGLAGIAAAAGNWPAPLPAIAGYGIAALVVAVLLLAAARSALPLGRFSATVMAGMLPLAMAPLFYKTAHASLALDAMLVAAALLAVALGQQGRQPVAAFVRLPIALVLGYGVIQAVRYDAWPLALASLLVTLGGLYAARVRP